MKHAIVALASAVALAWSGAKARADSVNLLTAVPTTVAVSSTVDNASILPAHLVDGKLDTAWNSLTGELAGAWFGVRLPDDATADVVKLTVGFTKIDKKWGDLFTMNPRISTVRITHDGATVAEVHLDTNLRTLQEIPLGKLTGGEIVVHVLTFVDGTKANWREINVSEFQVWGTPGPSTPPSKTPVMPTVYVGSFAHSLVSKSECLAVAPVPKGAHVVHVESMDLTNEVAICRIEREAPDSSDPSTQGTTIMSLAAVKRGPKLALLGRAPERGLDRSADGQATGTPTKTTTVTLEPYDLTRSEVALKVTVVDSDGGPQYSVSTTTISLYRISVGAFKKVLEFAISNTDSTNGGTHTTCTLDGASPLTASVPATLDERCQIHHEGYPGNRDDHGHRTDPDWSKEVTGAFTWNDGAYQNPPWPHGTFSTQPPP